ncbi:MAG TPA: hypothetical protein VFB66_05710, partial [Tepidisphaeraceae bacterium]|nr:hypothetical protein [Tepidisphaeraceae bacterium]
MALPCARVLPVSVLAAILAPTLVTGGCVDSKGGPPLPLRTTIGPGGGSLVVGSGEVALNVPAGALAQDVVISVASGQVSPLPGWIDVGPPYVFAPDATAFAVPSQIVLPFSPRRVSAAVDPGEIRVGVRRASGLVGELVPTFVDTQSVTFDSIELGTFWVVAPDVIDASSSFPLNDGDVYHYDTGLVLTVDRTTAEPNLAPLE